MTARVFDIATVRRLLDRAARARALADKWDTGVAKILRAMAKEMEREARVGCVCAAPAARVGIGVRASV